jgi:hypothetical protein
MNQTIKSALEGPFRHTATVVWRIAAIPLLVFMAGLCLLVFIGREPDITVAAPGQTAQHLAWSPIHR